VLVGIAVIQRSGRRPPEIGRKVSDQSLFEGIDLRSLTSIDVEEGTNAVVLALQDGEWVVTSLYDYPADFERLADVIRSAADAETGRPVRSGNVDVSEYGFGRGARRIMLSTGNGEAAGIEVGALRHAAETAEYATQYFVRRIGDPSIYLVDYDFDKFSAIAEDWIDRQLIDIRAARIVEIRTGDLVLREGQSGWMLEGMDPEKEELQPDAVSRLQSALEYLSLDSLADPDRPDAELGFNQPDRYVAKTGDGLICTVLLGAETGEGRFARLSVSCEKPDPPARPGEGAEDSDLEAYQQTLNAYDRAFEATTEQADELNARFAGWTYRLSPNAADSLVAGREALVQEISPPAEAEALPAE